MYRSGQRRSSPAVIKVDEECFIAEKYDGLVVVSVHVAHEEVQHRHVHDVIQATTLVVWGNLLHHLTVVVICRGGKTLFRHTDLRKFSFHANIK